MSTYMPELIGLTSYTSENYLVSNVLNLSVIKNRGLNIGQLWFRTEFEKGRMHNISQEQMTKKG